MTRPSKNSLRTAAKKAGFSGTGSFLVAVHSQDVVSGLALDVAPSSTYISTFVLPTFDALSFMHMSLGRRVAICSSDTSCLDKAIEEYKSSLSSVKSSRDLMEYIASQGIVGEYAVWTNYICLIRLKYFAKAREFRVNLFDAVRSPSIRERMNMLIGVQDSEGDESAYQLLAEWSLLTKKLLPSHH